MGDVSLSTKHGRALSLVLTTAAIAMALTAWWYYSQQRAEIEEATIRQLTSVCDAKVQQIANWRRERLGDGRVLAASPASRIAERILSGEQIGDRDRGVILDMLSALSTEFGYTNGILVDVNGKTRLRLNSDASDSDHLPEFVRAATRASSIILSDLYRDPRNQRSLMALIVPLHSLGAFVLDIDGSRFLFPYLQSWPTPSSSAETLLVRREGDTALVLNDVRSRPGTAMLMRRSLKDLAVPTDEQLKAGWLRRGTDYRGVQVLSSLRSVPDSSWAIVAKIDSEEVEAPIRKRWWEMMSLVLLIGIANVSGIALIWRSRQLHEHEERDKWARTIANDTAAYLWMSTATEENSFINKPLAKFLGKPQQRLPGQWTSDLHPDDVAAAQDKFHACQERQCEYSDEFRLRRHDGEYRWVRFLISPNANSRKNYCGMRTRGLKNS
jgi:PAS domain S-box-containing protein